MKPRAITLTRNFSHQQNGRLDTAMATNTFPSGLQAIATAYGEYTKKSYEDTKSLVEKLSAVRSIDKAIEVQTEFAMKLFDARTIAVRAPRDQA
jgi:hypothetical protein